MGYIETMYKQLSEDMCIDVSCFPLSKNYFTYQDYRAGRRKYEIDDSLLNIICLDGHIIVSSKESKLLDWMEDRFSDLDGEWACDSDVVFPINSKIRHYGSYVSKPRLYMTPKNLVVAPYIKTYKSYNIEYKIYNEEEIDKFICDRRFKNAVGFSNARPDKLVLAALIDNKPIGIAGVSADSPIMWQIGVDVLPEFRGIGLGKVLVSRLGCEVERLGVVPFYSTGASHIQSQRLALSCGYVPAWWQLYTRVF